MDTDREWEPFPDCTPECAVPVPCPECGALLPPRGRSAPLDWPMRECCQKYRHARLNTRHVWSVDELRCEED